MEELKKEYISKNNEDEFTMWFNMNYVEDTIDTITVSVASKFMQQMMNEKGYFEIVQNKLRQITGQNSLNLKCIIREEKLSKDNETPAKSEEKAVKKETAKSESEAESEIKPKTLKKHPSLQEEFNFDTFIPGDNSDFAYKASIAIAKEPGKKYNPMLLYGGSGLGKTHLMQAIGNYIYQNGGEKLKICYVSAETFGNDFTASLASKKTNEFKNKYRNLDVLLLDDIHFLQNKEGMQMELFYTFEALSQKNAQMVFTCDRPIKETKNMADRLVSRLSNGLCIDLQPPNYETRYAILQKKLELKNENLPAEIVDYIAKNVETNVRDLEAALNKITGWSELTGQQPDLGIAQNLLRDIISHNSLENISIDIIQKVVADNYNISVSELKGKKKDKKFAFPRQIAIYIIREITEMAYTEIGDEFGKDHSTIMHAYKSIEEKLKIDSNLEAKIQLLIREIKDFKR